MAIGAGWQAAVAYVNIACYYVVGIPLGLILGYKLGMGVRVSLFSFMLKPLPEETIRDLMVLSVGLCLGDLVWNDVRDCTTDFGSLLHDL